MQYTVGKLSIKFLIFFEYCVEGLPIQIASSEFIGSLNKVNSNQGKTNFFAASRLRKRREKTSVGVIDVNDIQRHFVYCPGNALKSKQFQSFE